MRFNAFYSEDLPAWLPGCLLLPSYPSFLPATIALTPPLHLPLSFARRASPAFHPSASQPSFLSAFQIDGFTKEGQRGRTEETDRYIYIYIHIYIYTYIGKRKKKKKRGKQVERLSRLCLTYTLVQKRGFVYFFPPRVRPSRIIAPPGKILDEILVARTWRWMSTLEIYTADGCEKKARAGSRESTAWTLGYKPGWREGCRNGKIVERFFKRRCLKFTLQVGRRSEIFGGRAARMSVTYCTW